MIAQTRIDEDLKPAGFDWITRPAQRHDPAAGERAGHPARPVRHLGAGQRDGRGLPRRAPAGVFQPAGGGRAAAQAGGAAASDRDGGGPAARYTAGKYDRDEFNRRLGGLRRRKMGKHFEWTFEEGTGAFSLAAEGRVDPGREAPGRDLRDPHEPGAGGAGGTARRWRRTRAWRGSSARSAR